jgi:hypothetical protein
MRGEVERLVRSADLKSHAVLPRDIGQAAGDVCATYEDDPLDLGPDRRQCSADIVAAIEKSAKPRVWDRLARRGDDCPEPTRPDIAPGSRRAGERNGAPAPRRSP